MNSQVPQLNAENRVMTLYVKSDIKEYYEEVQNIENKFNNHQKAVKSFIIGALMGGITFWSAITFVEEPLKKILLTLGFTVLSLSIFSLFTIYKSKNNPYLNNKEAYVEERMCGRDILIKSIQDKDLVNVNFNLQEVNSDSIEIRFGFKQGKHFIKYSGTFIGKMQYSIDDKYQNKIVMEVGINEIQVICYYKDKIPLTPFVDFQQTEEGQLVSMTKI